MSKIEISIDKEIISFVEEKIKDFDVDLNEKIHEIVCFLLNEEKIDVDIVSVCISKETKEGIRKINKEYRNIDKSTDVLSFPIFEKEELLQNPVKYK